jgi:hypothetical protein
MKNKICFHKLINISLLSIIVVFFPACTKYKVGDVGPAGGTIIYDKGSRSLGWRYLEVAPVSLEFRSTWGLNELDVKGTSPDIGAGKANTRLIIRKARQSGTKGTAAQLCAKLKIGRYKDWFLPSVEELSLMHDTALKRRREGRPHDYSGDWYWSSTQSCTESAFDQYFGKNKPNSSSKAFTARVRAIRRF